MRKIGIIILSAFILFTGCQKAEQGLENINKPSTEIVKTSESAKYEISDIKGLVPYNVYGHESKYMISENVSSSYAVKYLLNNKENYENDALFHIRIIMSNEEYVRDTFVHRGYTHSEMETLNRLGEPMYWKIYEDYDEEFKKWLESDEYKQGFGKMYDEEYERYINLGYAVKKTENEELKPYDLDNLDGNYFVFSFEGYLTLQQISEISVDDSLYLCHVKMFDEDEDISVLD